MSVTKFVVTGCSRSGTQYISQLLSSAGYRCGHESIFNFEYLRSIERPTHAFLDFPHLDGDSSSGAAPFLRDLPSGTVVLHQVRHPIECLRSHIGIHSFADDHVPSRYLADDHVEQVEFFEGRHCSEMFRHADESVRCMAYWVLWNQLVQTIEGAEGIRYFRYRVEDMHLPLLRRIVRLLGGPPEAASDEALEKALASVSRTSNTRLRDQSITWETLPECSEKSALGQQALKYGYVL